MNDKSPQNSSQADPEEPENLQEAAQHVITFIWSWIRNFLTVVGAGYVISYFFVTSITQDAISQLDLYVSLLLEIDPHLSFFAGASMFSLFSCLFSIAVRIKRRKPQ